MNAHYQNFSKTRPLQAKTLYFLIIAISLSVLSACAPKVIRTDAAKHPAKDILVLSGRSFVPTNTESPTYANTLFHVAEIYSAALSNSLNKKGSNSTLYINNNNDKDNSSILTEQIAKKHEDACIEIFMHHVRNNKENTIYLEAVFYPLVYEHLSNGHSRVIPQTGPSKSYPMLSTTRKKDLRNDDISNLAEEFVKELKTEGYIE